VNLFVAQSTNFQNNSNSVLKGVRCDESVFVGALVRAEEEVLFLASASTYLTSNVFGVIEKKVNPTECWVRVSGVTESLYSGLEESEEYFLSTNPGHLTAIPPNGSGVVVLRVGQPFSSSRLLLSKGVRIVRT
jgi:hypothetical protein